MAKRLCMKRGDTLVEVAIAIGIFSLLAISVVSVVNTSTSSSQSALENTLTRAEIDAQAEALRFIHDSYIGGGESNLANNTKYARLWAAITEQAEANVDSSLESILTYNPRFCSDVYNADDTGTTLLQQQNAFLINTRLLGDRFSGYNTTQINTAVDNIVVKSSDGVFSQATTYPRLIYNNASDNVLLDASTDTNLSRAEGIYIVAVKESKTSNSTSIITGASNTGQENSAYYDFYIRTCWYSPNAEHPSTISTVIRLYDPSAVDHPFTRKVVIAYNGNGGERISGQSNRQVAVYGSTVNLYGEIFTRDGYTFNGWNTAPDGSGTSYGTGAEFHAERTTVLYAQWEERVPITITYTGNGGDEIAGQSYTQELYAGDEVTLFGGDIYSRPGFSIIRWCYNYCVSSWQLGATVRPTESTELYPQWEVVLQELTNEASMTGVARFIDSRNPSRPNSNISNLRLVDGRYVLTNLSIVGNIPSDGSNFSTPAVWNVAAASLEGGNSYTEAQSFVPTAGVDRGMYNFCAASAGSNCSSTAAYSGSSDICPAGWSFPTADEALSVSSSIISAGNGAYIGGTFVDSHTGWWTSTPGDTASKQKVLIRRDGAYTIEDTDKSNGYKILCIRRD